jgi:hypothetical protein
MALNFVEPTIAQNYSVPNVNGNVLGVNNVGNVSNIQVIGQDPGRKQLVFHNPNATNNLLVSPTQDATGATLNPTFSSPGGGYLIFPGGFLTLTGDVQGAWQAIASTGVVNGITVASSRNTP